jgi:Rrf2 family protein
MRFSTRTEYGIRILVRLGRVYGNGPVSLSELAELEHLPLSYLEQIAGQLRRSGLVQSRMGAHGGYLLGRPPASVTMAEIVTSLEGSLAPVSCLAEGEAECHSEAEECSAHSLWERLQDNITATLQATTVADLIKVNPGPQVLVPSVTEVATS